MSPVSRPGALAALSLASLVLFAGCGSGKKVAAAKSAAPIPVVVEPAKKSAVPLNLDAIGVVEPVHSIAIKSLVTGLLMKVDFGEGQEVKQGDLLFEIDPRPFQIAVNLAEADVQKFTVQLETAEDQLARYASLLPHGMVSQEQYKNIENAERTLKAQLQSSQAALANARLQLEYCSIRAPIAGRTGSLGAHEGDLVRASDATVFLVTITQLSPIYVSFSVPQENLAAVQHFLAAGKITCIADPDARKERGEMTFVDSAVDAATVTIRLKATFDNADHGLWPGQYVDVRSTLALEPDLTVVPSSALQTGPNGFQVFVVRENNTAELRRVTTGRTVGDTTVILKGIKPGERVVVDGQIRLRPDSSVEVKKPIEDVPSLRLSGVPANSMNVSENTLPAPKAQP